MDALLLHIQNLQANGFESNACVLDYQNIGFESNSFEADPDSPWDIVGKELHPSQRFYVTDVRSKESYGEPMTFQQAYSLSGEYIGDLKTAEFLTGDKKIEPEIASSGHRVCSIGKSEDGQWYGWSHRAISGFPTKEEAKAFAESVSSALVSESGNDVFGIAEDYPEFFSESARAQNPTTMLWFRYNGTRRTSLYSKERDKFMVEKGDLLGIKYNTRTKELAVFSDEALDLPFPIDAKKAQELFKNSKPYRGKVAGKKVASSTKDWLSEKDRKSFDKLNAPKQTARKPAAKSVRVKPPKQIQAKLEKEKDTIAPKAGKMKPKDFHWFKISGRGLPKVKTLENGEPVVLEFEIDDVVGLRFNEDTLEFLAFVADEPDLLFKVSPATFRKLMNAVVPWRGNVAGLGRANSAGAKLRWKYWNSAEFKKEYNALKRADKEAKQTAADREFIKTPDAIDDGGHATTKKESKEIEAALNSGDTIWFAAGVTNAGRDKANTVFDTSKKKAIARLRPLMGGASGANIQFGVVSVAHGIYREYLKKGSPKAGITMHSARIQPLVRDAVDGTHGSTKSGQAIQQNVEVAQFNEKFEVSMAEKAPAFKGNDRELLLQISKYVSSDKAFTASFKPLAKLKKIKAGPCLVMIAKHNSERYRLEGNQAVRRMQRFYGTNGITGAFKENEGQLYLVVYLADVKVETFDGRKIVATDEIKDRAVRIRQFMLGEQTAEAIQANLASKRDNSVVMKDAKQNMATLDAEIGQLENAIQKREAKLKESQKLNAPTKQHESKLAEYRGSLSELRKRRTVVSKTYEDALETDTRLTNASKQEQDPMDSVYATKEGDQVRIVRANYRAGELIVTPTTGNKADYGKEYAITELFNLGGKQIL